MYRVYARLFVFVLTGSLPFAAANSQTPLPRVQYPPTRTVDHVDTYGTVKVADPYRWLEAIDSTSVTDWVRAENAVTMPYLAALPGRDILKQRITALYDFPRSSLPFWEGGRWFYAKNSGLQRQSVWYSRRTLDGPDQLVLDPNQLSPDGSIALSGFAPSPDGKSLAYGQSEGGSDWVTYYVRDLATGEQHGGHGPVGRSSAARRGRGMGRASSTRDTPRRLLDSSSRPSSRTRRSYYHRLGTPQSSRREGVRPTGQSHMVRERWSRRVGPILFVTTSKGTDKNELYLADLGDPMRPNVRAAVRPVVTGHDANYFPLGVANGRLYLQVDKDTPRGKSSPRRSARPSHARGRRSSPRATMPIEGASLVARTHRRPDAPGRRVGGASLHARRKARTRCPDCRDSARASGIVGPLRPPGAVLQLHVATLSGDGVRVRLPKRTRSRRSIRRSRRSIRRSSRPSACSTQSKDGTRVPMFITHGATSEERRHEPDDAVRVWRLRHQRAAGFPPGRHRVGRAGRRVRDGQHSRRRRVRRGLASRPGSSRKKQNVFDDFIAAGEYLIREKYTSPAKLGDHWRRPMAVCSSAR